MKKLLLAILLTFISSAIFSQLPYKIYGRNLDFIYGKMYGKYDSLVGYFYFDREVTQMGQAVLYKEDLNSKRQRFLSREYNYFISDSVYLEIFPAIHMLTGDVLVMIPRIINGRIQLFDAKYRWGYLNLMQSERFFIKKGNKKLSINKRDFKEQMRSVVGDDENLFSRIDNEELKYDDLVEIVSTYNKSHFSNKD